MSKFKNDKKQKLNEQHFLRKKIKFGSATSNEKERLAIIERELNEIRRHIKLFEDEFVTKAQVLGVTLSEATLNSLIYK